MFWAVPWFKKCPFFYRNKTLKKTNTQIPIKALQEAVDNSGLYGKIEFKIHCIAFAEDNINMTTPKELLTKFNSGNFYSQKISKIFFKA